MTAVACVGTAPISTQVGGYAAMQFGGWLCLMDVVPLYQDSQTCLQTDSLILDIPSSRFALLAVSPGESCSHCQVSFCQFNVRCILQENKFAKSGPATRAMISAMDRILRPRD